MEDIKDIDFQTPKNICKYMSDFLPDNAGTILEPTPGKGNLVNAIKNKGRIITPNNFYDIVGNKYDWIIMNPPFTPMKKGYDILDNCMNMSNNIIALMPWLVIINSKNRTQKIMSFGLKSITHLPRSVFKGSRVQCCVLELIKGYKGKTEFKNYVE